MLAARRRNADAAGAEWESAVFGKVKEEVKNGRRLTVQRMVRLARVSRASFYRFDEEAAPAVDPDMDLRDAIQRIALEWPSYGRRRITHQLRNQGRRVNWKKVYRLMREDNLLCVRRRKFVMTTDANHGTEGLSESEAGVGADGCGSALGDRYYLHSAAGGVRLSGRDPGCILTPS
ncbi:MAG TPA: IS3 family transposase [Terriglobales bacterium]|nr:IS3 family transposase [Terriglobales bacterium]